MAEQSFGPDARPWEELKEAFLARLEEEATAASATELWRLFARDEWFQKLLEARARRALASRVGRLDWLGDVKHEALLLLARQLVKTPDLRVRRELVDQTFPGWISAIVDRACGDAIRFLGRLQRLQLDALEKVPDLWDRAAMDARIDVQLAISAQEEPYRTLLLLSGKGFSVQEIAEHLELSYWETYRRLRTGMARLERRLTGYRHNRETRQAEVPVSSSSA